MSVRFSCHHDHQLQCAAELAAGQELICPVCGSIVRIQPPGDTKKLGSVDATITSDSISQGSLRAAASTPPAGSGLGDASNIVTIDHSSAGSDSGLPSAWQASSSPHGSPAAGGGEDASSTPPQLADYEVVEEIGRGGMGIVYRAREKKSGREVALKTLQRMSPGGLHRFKQEFRALADIAHPNLASLYELLSDGDDWCFSMEILNGVDFLEYVWSGFAHLDDAADQPPAVPSGGAARQLTPQQIERLGEALRQLAVGLDALHEAGMLHSDIKPSNVVMTRTGRLVLLDFGLVAQMQPAHEKHRRGVVQGTPLYMSPEQADAGALTAASDWYSVGVMLYEALSGRLPFQGSTLEVLHRKQTEKPQDPRTLQADLPAAISDLCMALLSRGPAQRPTAEDVLRCLGSAELAGHVAGRRTAALRSVELVGRSKHFDVLRQAFAEVAAGNTLSVFVHGESGMGKSVLVRRFLDDIQRERQAVVLQGRCYEQESVPFKALDSLIDSLADYLDQFSADLVQAVMPRDRLALTRVFPVLGRVPEAPQATYPTIENADQQELRQRAMNALRELLQRCAIREPLVLYIDDLQWGDVDSAGLLADLVRPPEAPRMLLLGSYRSEDAERSLCLRALEEAYQKGRHRPQRQLLAVESLSQDEARQLAHLLLDGHHETARGFADKIARESGGWPFFVWELVQHVQAAPSLGGQQLDLDEVIWWRVKRLPGDTIRLLELIAVAGRPMPAQEAYQALDAVAQGPGLLAQLRAGNFIRSTEAADGGTVVETYHDRIRESICSRLDAATVRQHNLNLALTGEQVGGIDLQQLHAHLEQTADFEEPREPWQLEKQQWQRVFDLACFFDAADQPQRALPYALVAAEQARKQNAMQVAEQQYQIAARGAEANSGAIQFRVAEGLGDVLVTRARYDLADQQFQTAHSLASDRVTLARINGKRGHLFFKKGDMTRAAENIEKGLAELGNPPPTNGLVQTAAALKEAFIQLLHTYLPSRFVARRSAGSEQHRMDMFRARLYDSLCHPYWFEKGTVLTLWTHLRHLNLAERYPPGPELARAYSLHAVMMTAVPLAARGAAYAERSYQIHGELGDLLGQGKARSFQTFALLVQARYREGVASGREAVRLLEEAGDVWEANMARMIVSQPMYFLGDLRGCYGEAKRAYEIGTETGDDSALAISLLFWITSAPQTIRPGIIAEELQRPRQDPLSCAAVIQARGLEMLLCEDEPADAARVLQESLDVASRRGLRNVCIFAGVTWKATALRMAAERADQPDQRRRALSAARRAVRAALKITQSYLPCRPQALRERALIAVLEGREEQARRFFDESLRVAEQHQARYEQAQTQLARGRAGQQFGWPDADAQAAAALAEVESLLALDD